MGDTSKVRAVEREDDAPAARSTTAGSVGLVAAELAGASLRDLGLADLSPAAIHQLAGVLDRLDHAERRVVDQRQAGDRSPQPSLDVGPAVLRILAVILGLIVVMVLVMGVLAGLRVADKLEAADTQQVQRTGVLEARVAEAEAKRLENQAKLDQARTIEEQRLNELTIAVDTVRARQDAMVLHLVDAVNKLAQAQGVKLPPPGTVLRIAKAEAEAKAGG